jgi:hypothetical protein
MIESDHGALIMPNIERRLEALEGRSGSHRPLVVLFAKSPNETVREAWARQHPGEPFDASADIIVIRWRAPEPEGDVHGRA